MNAEDRKYEQAKTRVKQIKAFYTHLVTYVVVNTLLFLINLVVSPDTLWFYWPLLGWGIGLVMHTAYFFGFGLWFGPDWEEKKIKEIMK